MDNEIMAFIALLVFMAICGAFSMRYLDKMHQRNKDMADELILKMIKLKYPNPKERTE